MQILASVTFSLANGSKYFHKLQHLSCSWWLIICQSMPFCTVAACFQECEIKSASQQKKWLMQCLWMNVWNPCYATPFFQPRPHFYPQVSVDFSTQDAYELNSGVTGCEPHSTALLWRQYCTCVSTICLFYSLVFLYDIPLVILHKDDVLLWMPPRTNGVELCVQSSGGFSSHVALEVTRF